MATAVITCPECSAAVVEGDRFCGKCGGKLAIGSADRFEAVPIAPAAAAIPPHALLAAAQPFCAACGADTGFDEATCGSCGAETKRLPARLEGQLGAVYAFRKGLRKRLAVRTTDEGDPVELLFESGEELKIPATELPAQADSPVPDDTVSALRTPHGRLIALAQACGDGSIKKNWDPDALIAVAVESVTNIHTARLVAIDCMTLGQSEVLDRLPLSTSERNWVRAVDAVRRGDTASAVDFLAALPAQGYRAKLALMASQVERARAAGVDLDRFLSHATAYAAEEPIAALMTRVLGAGDTVDPDQIPALAEWNRTLLAGSGIGGSLAADLDAALAAIAGDDSASGDVRGDALGSHARAVIALHAGRSGLIRPTDVDAVPLPLLDDMIEDALVDSSVVLNGGTDVHRMPYLTARLAPRALTDAEVDQLDHHAEQVRRAFRYADPDALSRLGDSPLVRHYQSLVALRNRKAGQVVVDDIEQSARPIVEGLLQILAASQEKRPIGELLSHTLIDDPTVWQPLVDIAGSTALRPTEDLRERYPAFVEWLAMHQAREHLFRGEWSGAVDASDRCLALAEGEAVRDEALNLKACALHYLGRDAEAIDALEEAVQGAHSEGLLANIGIVAAGLEPEVAARHLGQLMDEAPTVPLRVAAARRAVDIWMQSDPGSWRNSDNSPLPDAFQDPLRRLLLAPIAMDDFRDFAFILAIHDSDWLAHADLSASPHAASLEARFYRARATDLHQMVEVMGESMKGGSPPSWVLDERDSLRSAAVDILFENLDEPDSTFGSVALVMVDNDVLASRYDTLLFSALGIAGVTYHLSDRGDEVGDQIVARVHQLRREWQQLDSEDRVRLEPIVELATRRVALNRLDARAAMFDNGVDIYNEALDVGGRAQPGSPAYMEALRRIQVIAGMCREIRDEMRQWVPIVDHEGSRDDINRLVELTRDLETKCLEILN